MKATQFSQHIGNVADQLIEEAAFVPNYGQQHRRRSIRQTILVAAMIAMMTCSFLIGALAFSKNTGLEAVAVGDSGISIIFPESWEDKYGYEITEDGMEVYHLATRKQWGEAGCLFRIVCFDGTYPMDYAFAMPGRVIATTTTKTYAILFPSDVQYPVDQPEIAEEYMELSNTTNEVQIVLTDWMRADSTNQSNWVAGTVYIHVLDENMVTVDTIVCGKADSEAIGQLLQAKTYTQNLYPSAYHFEILYDGGYYLLDAENRYLINGEGSLGTVLTEEELSVILSACN